MLPIPGKMTTKSLQLFVGTQLLNLALAYFRIEGIEKHDSILYVLSVKVPKPDW